MTTPTTKMVNGQVIALTPQEIIDITAQWAANPPNTTIPTPIPTTAQLQAQIASLIAALTAAGINT